MARSPSSRSAPASIDASKRVVVLHGTEQFLLRRHAQTLIESLQATHGAFARFDFDGESVSAAQVLDELRSFGLLASHKLVVVEQADRFLAREGNRRLIEAYCAKPMEEATLLLRASKWFPGNLDKLIGKIGAIVACAAPTTEAAVGWLQRRCEKETGQRIDPAAAALLVDRIGPDLARLDTEAQKIASFAGAGETITVEHVRELTARSREEIVWDIQGPLMSGDAPAALATLGELYDSDPRREVLYVFAMVDALRKLHDGAALVEQGVRGFDLAKSAKIWGADRDRLLEAITNAEAACGRPRLAALFHAAVRTEQRTRNGEATQGRTALECLAVSASAARSRARGSR